MNFALDQTETEILEAVRALAARRLPVTVSGERPYRPFYEEAGELGYFALNLPASSGGLGLSDFHAGLVAYGFGRELVPGPWLEHLVAVSAAIMGGELPELELYVSGRKLAGELVTGERVTEGKLDTSGSTPAAQLPSTRAAGGVDAWLVALDQPGRGQMLVAVNAQAEGVLTTPAASVDLGWVGADVTLSGASCVVIDELTPQRRHRLALLAAGLGAMAEIGASERLLDDTVAYAKDREQFGRPIGAFQAVKHRLAELYIEIEHARNLAYAALAADWSERARIAPMAKLQADKVYRGAAETSIQLHGGFGFTWECTAHLFLKNALRLSVYPNPSEWYRRLIRSQLGLDSDPALVDARMKETA